MTFRAVARAGVSCTLHPVEAAHDDQNLQKPHLHLLYGRSRMYLVVCMECFVEMSLKSWNNNAKLLGSPLILGHKLRPIIVLRMGLLIVPQHYHELTRQFTIQPLSFLEASPVEICRLLHLLLSTDSSQTRCWHGLPFAMCPHGVALGRVCPRPSRYVRIRTTGST